MSSPVIPSGVDRREVIWPNAKLVLTTGSMGSATSLPQVGRVSIKPSATTITVRSTNPQLTLTTQEDTATLDASGVMKAYLVCTDDPDIDPHNSWTYSFRGDWAGSPLITCPVPMVDIDPETGKMPPLNLATIVSSTLVNGVIITKGDQGDVGPAVESIDEDGTVHFDNGSTVQWPLPPLDKRFALNLAISVALS